MNKHLSKPADQKTAFIAAAKVAAAEADTYRSRWEVRLKAAAKPPEKPAKKSK